MVYSHAHNAHEGFPSFPEIILSVIDRTRIIGNIVMGELTGMTERFHDHAAKSGDAMGAMTVLTQPQDNPNNGDDDAKSGELYSDRDRSHDKDYEEGEEPSSNGHKEK
jgi:hypothetical protein